MVGTMQSTDLEVIKDIPGYKIILKAVLKSQIQQLVDQLSSHTEEETVILTASVSDGTLCHMGSDSGKIFLEDHDDIKSQFLGFCLKRQHRQEREKQEAQQARLKIQTNPTGPGNRVPRFQPRFSQGTPVHPVALTRSGRGARHQPYVLPRLHMARGAKQTESSLPRARPGNVVENQVIKIEPDDSEEDSGQNSCVGPNVGQVPGTGEETDAGPSDSPLQTAQGSQGDSSIHGDKSVKLETDIDSIPEGSGDDNRLEDSASEPGLGLSADLSNLIDSEAKDGSRSNSSDPTTSVPGGVGEGVSDSLRLKNSQAVKIKVESISESDMELEITGVEPGLSDPLGSQGSQDSWAQGSLGYDATGATGSQTDLQSGDLTYSEGGEQDDMSALLQQTFEDGGSPASWRSPRGKRWTKRSWKHATTWRSRFQCQFCVRAFAENWQLQRHLRIHTGEKPYSCDFCDYRCSRKDSLRIHVFKHQKDLSEAVMKDISEQGGEENLVEYTFQNK